MKKPAAPSMETAGYRATSYLLPPDLLDRDPPEIDPEVVDELDPTLPVVPPLE
jgi:hypothetical protein